MPDLVIHSPAACLSLCYQYSKSHLLFMHEPTISVFHFLNTLMTVSHNYHHQSFTIMKQSFQSFLPFTCVFISSPKLMPESFYIIFQYFTEYWPRPSFNPCLLNWYTITVPTNARWIFPWQKHVYLFQHNKTI